MWDINPYIFSITIQKRPHFLKSFNIQINLTNICTLFVKHDMNNT